MVMTMTTYTINRYRYPTQDILDFIKREAPELNKRFGNKFNIENVNLKLMMEKGVFLVCERNGEIRGWLIAFLTQSPFDTEVKVLQQQSLFVIPDSGRAAYHLFKKFIDIGKEEADHIITMLTSQTNIKPTTLERMGFKELETLYCMES